MGCGVALVVFLLLVPVSVTTWLTTAIADTLDAVSTTAGYLRQDVVTTPAAKAARRDLHRCVVRLAELHDNGINGSANQRRSAEHVWPAMAATQRLAYRTVAECWRLEQLSAVESGSEGTEFADHGLVLRAMADAVRAGRNPPLLTIAPGALSAEVHHVRDTLERDPT